MSTPAMAPHRPTPAPIVSDRQAAAFAVLGTAPRATPLSRSVTVILDRELLGRYGLAGARLALATLALGLAPANPCRTVRTRSRGTVTEWVSPPLLILIPRERFCPSRKAPLPTCRRLSAVDVAKRSAEGLGPEVRGIVTGRPVPRTGELSPPCGPSPMPHTADLVNRARSSWGRTQLLIGG